MGKKRKADAPALMPIRPSLHMEGKDAERLHKLKPGAKVRMHVEGVVRSLSRDTYGGRTNHSATVEVHRVRPARGRAARLGRKQEGEDDVRYSGGKGERY